MNKNIDTNEVTALIQTDAAIMNLRLRYEQLCRDNEKLTRRLKTMEGSANYWKNEKQKSDTFFSNKIEFYNDLMKKYYQLSQLLEVKKELKHHQNSDVKVLGDIVSTQSVTIVKLQQKLNKLREDYENIECRKNNLEGTNQHLNNENVALRTKIVNYIEHAQGLNNENKDLQNEVIDLKKKHQELEIALDTRIEELASRSANNEDKNLNQTEDSIFTDGMKSQLTKLLKDEFTCPICNEVFIDAVITQCAHTFCSSCIKSWRLSRTEKPTPCPICRTKLIRQEIKLLSIDSFLTKITGTSLVNENLRTRCSPLFEERKKIKVSRKRRHSASNDNTNIPNSSLESLESVNLNDVFERLYQLMIPGNGDNKEIQRWKENAG